MTEKQNLASVLQQKSKATLSSTTMPRFETRHYVIINEGIREIESFFEFICNFWMERVICNTIKQLEILL